MMGFWTFKNVSIPLYAIAVALFALATGLIVYFFGGNLYTFGSIVAIWMLVAMFVSHDWDKLHYCFVYRSRIGGTVRTAEPENIELIQAVNLELSRVIKDNILSADATPVERARLYRQLTYLQAELSPSGSSRLSSKNDGDVFHSDITVIE